MGTTIPLSEAGGKLAELVAGLAPGDHLVLTDGDKPIARVERAAEARSGGARRAGRLIERIAQRHWDAAAFCYAVGGLAGLGFHLVGWSPFLGFGIALPVAVVLAGCAFAGAGLGDDDARW